MADIVATYRLQLHAGFPLSHALSLVPYLHRLGVSHIHCSPLLQARTGSTHGYDVVDPTHLDPELGTEEDLAQLVEALRQRGMGLVLDIVPNHMAASPENPAWEDLLAHGLASRYARWFDVDWRTNERYLRFRVLLPVLGDVRARVLARGEISLALEDGRVRVRYFEHSWPLDPGTLAPVLFEAAAECDRLLGPGHDAGGAFREIGGRLRRLPRRTNRSPRAIARRREVAAAELDRFGQLCNQPEVAEAVRRAAETFGKGAEGVVRLRRLLDSQVYRLTYWRRAAREINYRRFFDINDLIALHMEDPEVFAETHALVLEWRRRGWIDGFRIDHPDGLLDPLEYFRRLAGRAFPETDRPAIYVEKILSPGEQLRTDWPVAGTTGYDFLNQTESLFIEPGGYPAIEQEYRRIIRQPLEFGAIARLAKRRVLESGLSAGVWRLAQRLLKITGPDRALPSVQPHALVLAIVETIASLPVYRTYIDSSSPSPQGEDRRLLETALADARQRGRAPADALDLLAAALLAQDGPLRQAESEGLRLRFVQRFQQLSGPATAKGIEDTAFYSYAPLLSRNEVGGGPEVSLENSLAAFHEANRQRSEHWPRAMLATTTHDTKRTADIRSRLDVLSEIPAGWATAVERWRAWNRKHKRELQGQRAPDPNTVYHVLQALVGTWPLSGDGSNDWPDPSCLESVRERLQEYSLKAVREAKVKTSWTEPEPEFEAALREYVEAMLSPQQAPEFLSDLDAFVRRLARPGLWNGLSRTLLHLTAPGVPDLYQGDELWNFALVDPDNRRPVDYQVRSRLLDEIECDPSDAAQRRSRLAELVAKPEDGRVKLHVVRAALHTRRRHPELFLRGRYVPLLAQGPGREHLVGFARRHDELHAIVMAPRLLASRVLEPDRLPTDNAIWEGTSVTLPSGWPAEWRCALSGESVPAGSGVLSASDAFRWLPVALLLG
jgi:(1->4)-alpha-D-glucan 1-alpha-D-glucosylmutase